MRRVSRKAAREPENASDNAIFDEGTLYDLGVGDDIKEATEGLYLCPVEFLAGNRVDKFGGVEDVTAEDGLCLCW